MIPVLYFHAVFHCTKQKARLVICNLESYRALPLLGLNLPPQTRLNHVQTPSKFSPDGITTFLRRRPSLRRKIATQWDGKGP